MNQPKPAQDLTLSGLVHDLNNVFQTLVDVADLLADDPRWSRLSAAVLRSVERGRRITASLGAAGSPGAPFETILDDAIAFVEDSMLAGGGPAVQFACEVEPGLELKRNWAWERVLINLFLNARHAMPQGGTIQVRAFRQNGEIHILVRDSPCGIPPEILDRIFEPHVSTKSAGGLGLHVVETIVREEGGEVRAANRTDGPGAEFAIAIPAAAPRVNPAHA
jgi:signal transduction histidine kinase